MFKKSLIAVSLIVSALSFASENNNNNGKKYGFEKGEHSGPIYTCKNKDYSRIDVNAQWGSHVSEESKMSDQMKLEKAQEIMRKQTNYYQNDCVIN